MNPPTTINLDLLQILGMFRTVFTACSQWFSRFMSLYGDIWLFGVLIALSFRFFIQPVVGVGIHSAASDLVKQNKKKVNSSSKSGGNKRNHG